MKHIINSSNQYMELDVFSRHVIATYQVGKIQKVDVSVDDSDRTRAFVKVFIDDAMHEWQSDKIYLTGYIMYGIPVSKDGRFVFAQQDMNGLVCLDAITGDVIWKTKSKAEISHIWVGNQYLCVSKSRNEIQLIDIDTGAVVKSYHTPFDNRFEVLTDNIILNHTRSKFWEIISCDDLKVLQTISDDHLRKNRLSIEQQYKLND